MSEIVVDTQNYLDHNDDIQRGWHLGFTPWEESRYRLVSWWDMHQFTVRSFYNIAQFFLKTKSLYSQSVQQGGLTIVPEKSILTAEERLELKGYLESVEKSCQHIGLRNSVEAIREFRDELSNWKATGSTVINASQVATRIEDIDRAIRREMKVHLFMHIPTERAEYYRPWGESRRSGRGEEMSLFGDVVKVKFPSSDYDVAEAGNSFAVGRYTACVFHLMRVLEIGLTTLAKKFNVPSDHTNWHPIIEGVEKAIRNMGNDPAKDADWKSEQEFYAQVASHFMFLKEAWRNYTAHARGRYDEDEAKNIMENVRAFMQKLATRLSE